MASVVVVKRIEFAYSDRARYAQMGRPYGRVARDVTRAWRLVMAGLCPLHDEERLRVDPGPGGQSLVCRDGFDFFAWDEDEAKPQTHPSRPARVGMGMFRDTLETRRWWEARVG